MFEHRSSKGHRPAESGDSEQTHQGPPLPRHPATSAGHSRSGRVLLGVLLIAQLMVILDITAVNIALPSLATDLELRGSSVSWTITSYSLIFGSLLLLGGRAADLLGRRRMFLTGLGIFTASSFASALAGTAGALFAARAGQGLGAAMLSPAALAIIMSAFQGHQRAKALAAWGAVGGAGAAIGVLVGGVLTEYADWRTIFYVNLPVAAALALAALKVVPADTEKPRWKGLDLRGAVLATTSLGAIVFAITQAEGAGWTSIQTHVFGIGGLAGLAAFAALERRTATPLLRVERVADRAVGGGLFLMLAAAGSIFGLFLLTSLYLQNVLGWGPLSTGLAFIPLALAAGAGAHAAGHIVGKHGVRGPLAGAFLIGAAGMALLAARRRGRQLRPRRPARNARRRARARRRRRVRLDRHPHRGPRRGVGNDLRSQLDRPRDRRHARHRDLLDDRGRKRRDRRPADRSGHRARVRRSRSPRRRRQRGRPGRPAAGATLRSEAAAEPQRDAEPLTMAKPTTTPAEPPSRKPLRADAERSVAAILDAGLEALASDPDSSMSEIARRAGVVRATIYVHFPTRTALLDAVMEHAVAQVVEAMSGAEPGRGEPVEALERVLRATWRELARFHGLLALNTARLSAEELHRRHLPMLDQLEPLIERGQRQNVFRSDLPIVWHLAVIRAIVHTASREIQGGRIPESEAEAAMLSTAVAAISAPKAGKDGAAAASSSPPT